MHSAQVTCTMDGQPRLLIVDDELGVRESLRAILQKDCQVLTATSGEQALEIVSREPVDVVTLDLKMPGLGGIGVLERLKQMDPDVEVLIITGYGTIDTAVQGLRHRAFDYISKPFDCDQVRGLVQAAIARRVASRRMKQLPDSILSTLSHEFRTPLNVIMGYSTILEEESGDKLSQEQRQALDRIRSNSGALLAYIETLFYMAELDRGAVPLAVAPVRLADVLAKLKQELAPLVAERGITLQVDASTGLVMASDEDKTTKLLRALVDNAVRFTTSGGVVVTARPASGGATVEIQDTGSGLPAELIVETEDVIAGRSGIRPPRQLGFGLRLAGRLVRALGASLTLVGRPEGTVCHLVLPDLATADAPRVAYGG
jgi:signal transduction histidine kinase